MIKSVTAKEAEEYGFIISGNTAIIGTAEIGPNSGIAFCLGEDDMESDSFRLDSCADMNGYAYSIQGRDQTALQHHLEQAIQILELLSKMDGVSLQTHSILGYMGFDPV